MTTDGKVYWRSLREKAADPRVRAFLEREFPEASSELPEGVSRRTMLMLLGASLSMAGLAACRRPAEKIVPYVTAPEEVVPGIPLRYATTMPFGLGAYGLVVESHEGRPGKIEGNELHPSTAGSSSAWIQAAILDLYDPDRLGSVLAGSKRKSWAEFLTAWQALDQSFSASGGEGLALLTESYSSPTLARLSGIFRQRFPRARVAAWEPVSDENLLAGLEPPADRVMRPVYHLDGTVTVLALDSDLLHTDSESIRHSRGFAERRRTGATTGLMNRLYVVESALSLTGANADHRLRVQGGQVAAVTALLAAELRAQGLPLDVPAGGSRRLEGVEPDWFTVVAKDLLAQRGSCLILAGRRQPPAVHAAVLAMNRAMGNVGRTVTYHALQDAAPSRERDLQELAGAMRAGQVSALVVLGGNPVYAAAADLDFAGALDRVAQIVHLGSHHDETSQRAHWSLPQAHFLESWGDCRAADGTLSVVQPLIEPLFGGRSSAEVLALLATGKEQPGYELVRETWRALLDPTDFESRFSRVLHDGLLAGSASPPVEPGGTGSAFAELSRVAVFEPATGDDFEIAFAPSPGLFDGRFANNGWLQELPDPVTRLTWDNAALISPATAGALGVETEDVVLLGYGGREIEAPVFVLPGHADHAVSLHLGYGRRASGRVGDGHGFDAYRLRSSAALHFDRGLRVQATGRRHSLAQTQEHWSMEGRPIVREATLMDYKRHPGFAREAVEHPPLKSPWREHAYDQGHQWGMSIDLNVCTGCGACVVACQSENNIPVVGKEQVSRGREMHWIRVDRYFSGSEEQPETVFQPVPCMHCENAPCEQVCPVAATVHDAEGLNTMVYNRCIGTRYCSNNCPYKVRRFNFFNYTKDTPEIRKIANNPEVTVRSRGVMEKCTYCVQRINAARIHSKLEGRELRDGDIRTACEQACPAQAIVFGDIRDPESQVSRRKSEERDYAVLAELNNKPRTTYLAKLRNPHPGLIPMALDGTSPHERREGPG